MKIPEYLSRSNKVIAIIVAVVFFSGIMFADYTSTKNGEEKSKIDFFDKTYREYVFIFDFESVVKKNWIRDKKVYEKVYGDYNGFRSYMLDEVRPRHLSDSIWNLFFVSLFPVHCILFFLFYPKAHPFVVDRSRRVIYTVRRGQVYLFKMGDAGPKEMVIRQDDGELLISPKEIGCANIWLTSISTGKMKKFYLGFYPPSPSMSHQIEFNITCALLDNEYYSADKIRPLDDNLKPLRWFFELSLYPYFLHKKVDDPKYLQQIDAYLAGLDGGSQPH